MESVIPCEPNGSRDSLLSPTDSQQAVDYRDFCYMFVGCSDRGASYPGAPDDDEDVPDSCQVYQRIRVLSETF